VKQGGKSVKRQGNIENGLVDPVGNKSSEGNGAMGTLDGAKKLGGHGIQLCYEGSHRTVQRDQGGLPKWGGQKKEEKTTKPVYQKPIRKAQNQRKDWLSWRNSPKKKKKEQGGG